MLLCEVFRPRDFIVDFLYDLAILTSVAAALSLLLQSEYVP